MKFSVAFGLVAASLVAAVPSNNQIRSVGDVLPTLKRDVTGAGFTHVGSDNVVRSFDKDFNVVDFANLDSRAVANGVPSADVLAEAKAAKAKAVEQTSKPRQRSPLDARQEKSCPSESCPDDTYCKDLKIYGYDCSTCLSVTHTVGNCQK
ncbi:hypothetical protein F5Y11DRAFT_214962 [Daldinia sp. FL1419]|nr:hypothetical protein F5Y11DRAFT_214962 [Daldinia sp. FL1419]